MAATENLGLADVARLAGVSPATASRALNNAYGVSSATRARVVAVAESLNYVVSPDASRLARGTRRRVALVVPHIERWFFGAMVSGIESVLSPAGFDVLLYHVGGTAERRRFFEELPARRKVDAVMVVALPVASDERRRLELMGVVVVAAGGQNADYPYVCIDDRVAGRQAVDHLLQLRHTRIGMIEARDPDRPRRQRMPRTQAYRDALDEAGIEVDPALTATVDWGPEHGARGMAQLLALPRPPTAVYAHSDEIAFGALSVLRRAGLRVPDDLSLVGIDGHPLAEYAGLTTVAQPVPEQGQLAARMLLAMLAGEADVDRAVHVPTRLVVHGSTRALRRRRASR